MNYKSLRYINYLIINTHLNQFKITYYKLHTIPTVLIFRLLTVLTSHSLGLQCHRRRKIGNLIENLKFNEGCNNKTSRSKKKLSLQKAPHVMHYYQCSAALKSQ